MSSPNNTDQNNGPILQPPITGAEYLEKIVHLPVHLPRWLADQVEQFLLAHYPDLFFATESQSESTSAKEDRAGTGDEPVTTKNTPLLNLFKQALPPVPRKLIRAAEGMLFKIEQLHALDGASFLAQHDPHREHVARIVLLQQIYPEIFRLLRSHSAVYDWLYEATVKDKPADSGSDSIEREASVPRSGTTEGMIWPKFAQAVLAARINRYDVSPLSAFGGDQKVVSPLSTTKQKRDFKALYVVGERLHERKPTATDGDNERDIANLNLPDGDVIASLLLPDKSSRQGFLVDQNLPGKRLPDLLFNELIKTLKQSTDDAVLTDIDWLRDMADILSPRQLQALYKDLRVLEKIQTAPAQTGKPNHG